MANTVTITSDQTTANQGVTVTIHTESDGYRLEVPAGLAVSSAR